MAGAQTPTYVLIPMPAPRAVREVTKAHSGAVVLELCDRCWGPYLAGKLNDHLEALPHRQPPMGANSPEG